MKLRNWQRRDDDMCAQVTNLPTFVQATNQLMLSYGILQIPVSGSGDSLNYGRMGTPIKTPDRMVFMGAKIPIEEFMSFLPMVERPATGDLDHNAVEGRRDVLSQWWSIQRFVNDALTSIEAHGKPKSRAAEKRKEGEEAEKLGLHADAAWAFLESAVILHKLGMPNGTVTVELYGSARNFDAAGLNLSSAVLFEAAYKASHSVQHASGAAGQWLQSLRRESEAGTMRFRVNRGLIYAAHRPEENVYRDLLVESGKLQLTAGRYFAAGADYMRAAWSMIECGKPDRTHWTNVSMFLMSAADVFRMKEDDVLVHKVRELSDIALKFAEAAS